jgi:glycosidase
MINPTPARLRAASMYQIFPRNYTREGTLEAAAARLPGVKKLGFDYVYLTPVHPIGVKRRKGGMGCPYAIADYRAVDPLLGGEEGLRLFMDRAHELDLAVIMDVVYNHTSPDSILAREHPSWFWKGPDGRPGPRVADWSDVADLDYSHRGLWDYQIESLEAWAEFGADGFRCDVASLVPVEFWMEARRRLSGVKSLLWLAESVHKEFVVELRRRGQYAASDPELHAAFDLTYDYDGREELEAAWRGAGSLTPYLKHLQIQEALYPESAVKLRFLENHDQQRAAFRFGRGARLRTWTVFAMLLPGTFMAYMGQELAMDRRIGLFDAEPILPGEGDESFLLFFAKALSAARRIKESAPVFDARLVAEGVLLIRRRPTGGAGGGCTALLNLDGRSGKLELHGTAAVHGEDLISGAPVKIGPSIELGQEPIVVADGARGSP